MLGQAKPFFTLIAEAEDRAEVDRAANEYKRTHPGAEVVVDRWKDHLHHTQNQDQDHGVWRARARIVRDRSLLEKIFNTITR